MTQAAMDALEKIVGRKNLLAKTEEMRPFLEEWRGTHQGAALCVVKPSSAEDVSAIVKIARAHGLHIVPQSGNTGLVGGQIGFDAKRAVMMSMTRMTKIRALDQPNNMMTAEAGAILTDLHDAAKDANRLFPISLASEGSARLGGILASNAGGHNVLRYGMARDLVAGLEVVLADGRLWNGLSALKKDNAGYDLKNLFIGSEGTLGIITAAVLKLFPRPQGRATFFAALKTPKGAAEILREQEGAGGAALSAFEIIPRMGLDFVLKHISGTRDPFHKKHLWYLLGEIDSEESTAHAHQEAERLLARGLEKQWIEDALLASSLAQARSFWKLRESLSEAQKHEGAGLKHDISVPVGSVPVFLDRAQIAIKKAIPHVRVVAFGHVGDGNVHFNLSAPHGMKAEAFLALKGKAARIVYDLVDSLGGSISAEHGIGVAKLEDFLERKSSVEIDMMKHIKRALDPQGILNRGKMFPESFSALSSSLSSSSLKK